MGWVSILTDLLLTLGAHWPIGSFEFTLGIGQQESPGVVLDRYVDLLADLDFGFFVVDFVQDLKDSGIDAFCIVTGKRLFRNDVRFDSD